MIYRKQPTMEIDDYDFIQRTTAHSSGKILINEKVTAICNRKEKKDHFLTLNIYGLVRVN